MDFWPILLFVGALLLLFGMGLFFLFYYICVKRPRYRKEHITAHTTGIVEGKSHFTSNDIVIPLVRYKVNGQTYKVAGPRFAGGTNTSFEIM